MTDEPNLFNQPDPEPAPKLDPGTKAVTDGAQRARARDLERRKKRIGPPLGEGVATNEELFRRFHDENPHVYRALVKLALRAKAAGIKKWGINAVIEVFRWEWAIETKGDTFKINNNHAPHYARMIMAREPALEDFFNTREIRA